jgi:hypothetical protein
VAPVWRRIDATTLGIANAGGLILIVVGWLKASGEVRVAPQLPWVSWAAVGLILAGVGNSAWLLAGRRAVGLRRAALLPERSAPAQVVVEPMVRPQDGNAPLLATPDMVRYHRADCLLLAGKPAEPASAISHAAAGRRPCDVCLGEDNNR